MVKYYVDIDGKNLGGFSDNNPSIPTGAILVSGPPLNSNQVWNNTSKVWEGSNLTWDNIRELRVPFMEEAINFIDKYRNQQLTTGGITDAQLVKITEWANYLQSLRDLTDTTLHSTWLSPDDVVWPSKPI